MKIGAVWNLLAASTVALVTSLGVNANAELAYGVSDQLNLLISFNTATPQTVITAQGISGLANNESIIGIDYIGSTLYGLGNQSHLYTINPNTAAATQVGSGQFTPALNGINFGFNSSGSVFYIASDLGQNMTLTSGAVGAAGTPYTAGSNIDGMAYDHVSGLFYGISAVSHNWMTLTPSSGLVTTVGPTGINFSTGLALDISPVTDIAYFTGTVTNQTQLYTVNKSTGALTLVGNIGSPGTFNSGLNAMAIVPEPTSVALFAVGGLLIGLLIRKK